MNRFPLALMLVAAVGVAVDGQATWTGAVDGNWFTSGNWAGNTLPSSSVGATIPAGTPHSPSLSSAATCLDLTVVSGATLTIAAGAQLDVLGAMGGGGSVQGAGFIRASGGSPGFIQGLTIANVEIAKIPGAYTYVIGAVAATGSLIVTEGILAVGNYGAGDFLSVGGNATFQGGYLYGRANVGTIEVAGHTTFMGGLIFGAVPSFICHGNWTCDTNVSLQGHVSTVTMAGPNPQTISGTGPNFTNLIISAVASVTTTGNLLVHGDLNVNGALSVGGVLDVDRHLTVATGATLNTATGTHAIGGNLSVYGTLNTPGLIRFDTDFTATVTAVAPLANDVEITKNSNGYIYINGALTISGSLTLALGFLQVGGYSASDHLSIGGNASFQGGLLTGGFNIGTIDVTGNVAFSGTFAAGNQPTIRCHGNWTADGSYAPNAPIGTAIFQGPGPHVIGGSGPRFQTVIVPVGSSVNTSVGLVIGGALSVVGSLTSTATNQPFSVGGSLTVSGTLSAAATLDVDGDLSISAGASVAAGAGTHTLAANLTVNGALSAPGVIRLDTGGTTLIQCGPGLASDLEIAKSPGAYAYVIGALAATGSLTVTGGILSVGSYGPGDFLSVGGNATFQGGYLGGGANVGTIEVAGHTTFTGSLISGTVPSFICHGNWTCDNNFSIPGHVSTVTMAGPNPQTIGGTGANFTNLTIGSGSSTTALADVTIFGSTFTIQPGGTFNTGARKTTVEGSAATTVSVNGVLTVPSDGELALGPGVTATVGASGTIQLLGTSALPAVLSGASGGGYAFNVDGTIAASNFVCQEMGANGISISSAAQIAPPPNDLRNGVFTNPSLATNAVLLRIERPAPQEFFDLSFLNQTTNTTARNVRTTSPSAPITFTDFSGAFSGPPFENDPNNLITWNPSVTSFTATPGLSQVSLAWQTINEFELQSSILERSTSLAGPFIQIAVIPSTGVGAYSHLDTGLVGGQVLYYRLSLRRIDNVIASTSTISATPSGPPIINTGPQSQNVCAGASVTFAIGLSGSAPFTYLWSKDGVPTGVTSASYPAFSATPSNAGVYRVQVTNAFGSVTSAGATLIVRTPPVVTTPPASGSACVGFSATLSVVASGTVPHQYQWFHDGMAIAGATSNPLIIPSFTTREAGSYHVVVSNSCGSATSAAATLAAVVSPVIATHPTSQSICPGTAASFTVALAQGTSPITYTWRHGTTVVQASTNPTFTIPNAVLADLGPYTVTASNGCTDATSQIATLAFDQLPAITSQTGNQVPLPGAEVTLSVDARGTPPFSYQWRLGGMAISDALASTYTFTAPTVQGVLGTYDCVVSNQCPNSATASAPITVTVAELPQITQQPANVALSLCGNNPTATFTVSATSQFGLTYQWRWNSNPITGATGPSLTLSQVTQAELGVYDVVVTNIQGSVTSSGAVLSFAGFSLAGQPSVGNAPKDVAMAELLAPLDGIPDVITADSGSDTVTVMRLGSNAVPTSIVSVPLVVGDSPSGVAAGSLISGGGTDLAVACPGNGVVRVLSNSGTLVSATSIAAPPGTQRPVAVASANLNGTPAIAMALEGSAAATGGGVAVALGNGATFGSATLLPAPSGGFRRVKQVAFADLDGDQDLDLVATMGGTTTTPTVSGNILLYANAGNGSFTLAGTLSANQNPRGLAIADLDGDGKNDVAVTYETPVAVTPGGILIFIHGNNAGMSPASFNAPLAFSSGVGPVDVVAVDLGDDTIPGFVSKMDLVTVNAASVDLSLYRSFTGSAFTTTTVCAAPGTSIAAADLNRDAAPDLVASNESSGRVNIVLSVSEAQVQVFGTGCSGTGGLVPQLSPIGLPRFGGAPFGVQLSNARAASPVLAVFSLPPTPLAQPLGGGCMAYVTVDQVVLQLLTDAQGAASASFGLPPAQPPFIGMKVTAQLAVLDPSGAYMNTLALSNGLRLRFGF